MKQNSRSSLAHRQRATAALLGGVVASIVAATGCATTQSRGPRGAGLIARDSIARAAIAREASIDPSRFPRGSVGVAPLRVVSRDTALSVLGYGLADLIMTDLARSRQVVVVERLQLAALLKELELAETGRVDSATAPRVGRLMGARNLVFGDVGEADAQRLRLSARLADVQGGEIRETAGQLSTVDQIVDAQKAVTLSLFERMGVNLTPAERQRIEERPTRNLAALLAYSRAVRAEFRSDWTAAAQEYRNATTMDPQFRQARDRGNDAQARAEGMEARPAEVASSTTRLTSLTDLTTTAINRNVPPVVGTTSDPAFQNAAIKITIVILVNIP